MQTGETGSKHPLRFGPQSRLREKRDFDRVFRLGRRFRQEGLTVCRLDAERPHARLGVVVSRKASPLSTRRHRLKRMVRESFRLAQHRLSGMDIIVMFPRGFERKAQRCDEKRLWQTLNQIWSKLGA